MLPRPCAGYPVYRCSWTRVKAVLSAFDHDGFFYKLTVEGSHDSNSGENSPKLAATGSNIFSIGEDVDNLGVAAAISWYDREFATDNVETGGEWDFDGGARLKEVEMRDYTITRERLGAVLNFDYKLDKDNDLYLRTLYSQFRDDEQRQGARLKFDGLTAGQPGGLEVDDGEVVMERELKDRDETQKIMSVVFVNDKNGTYQQYQLVATAHKITGYMVRTFSVESQPEGCVANDNTGQLFVGEEDSGIWVIGADPEAGTRMTSLAKVGDVLHDDVEGMGIYEGTGSSFLVVSSQGNNSYAVFEALEPYRYRGSFRIGMNAQEGIDGASETDGLEVTSANLGGVFSEGMLVVQDGRNVMPSMPQNFKYVPWNNIRVALNLD